MKIKEILLTVLTFIKELWVSCSPWTKRIIILSLATTIMTLIICLAMNDQLSLLFGSGSKK